VRVFHPDSGTDKGWFTGPWDSDLPISIGYANTGVDDPHYHREITEIYFVARGCAIMRVEDREIAISPGQAITIEPGETHTFVECSEDFYHFVVQTPGLQGEAARLDKVVVACDLDETELAPNSSGESTSGTVVADSPIAGCHHAA
jgi:mannose-6-phosphate isomerase-like protein (cupin superfamily)